MNLIGYDSSRVTFSPTSKHLNGISPVINLKYATLNHFYFTQNSGFFFFILFISKQKDWHIRRPAHRYDWLTPDNPVVYTTVWRVGENSYIPRQMHVYTYTPVSPSISSLFISDTLTHKPSLNLTDYIRVLSTHIWTPFKWSLPILSWDVLMFLFFVKFLVSTLFVQICVVLLWN